MSIMRAVIAAFSCFSSIPMPQIPWDSSSTRHMMAAFPIVGVVIGASLWLWAQFCIAIGAMPTLLGAGLTLLPILISGAIHMDGFADVLDAQASHASPERKREILKDPHVGAFALVGTGCYLIAYFSLACEVNPNHMGVIVCIPIISRCLSGLATVTLRAASSQGMYASEHSSADTGKVRAALVAETLVAAALMLHASLPAGACALTISLVTCWWVWRLAKTQFGGMSGDLAGFYLQVAELAMLVCAVLAERLV